MQFGYFTLSDKHYVDNRRGANELIAGIRDEALSRRGGRESIRRATQKSPHLWVMLKDNPDCRRARGGNRLGARAL